MTEEEFLKRYASCDPAKVQYLVGQRYDRNKDAATIEAASAGGIRLIRPGEAIAMDYSSGRLNIELDRDETVIRVWCG